MRAGTVGVLHADRHLPALDGEAVGEIASQRAVAHGVVQELGAGERDPLGQAAREATLAISADEAEKLFQIGAGVPGDVNQRRASRRERPR